ncbi:creatininase family protein [Virgibacillus oceani]
MNQLNELQMERLTSPQIKKLIDQGVKTAIVPTGAIEQHGPHLPLLMDSAHATYQGIEVAKLMGNVLVAPTIRIGFSEHHMKFSGTISYRRSTFKSICEDYCISLAQHGFNTICLFSCHGGNFPILKELESELNSLVGAKCQVIVFSEINSMYDSWRAVAEEWGGLGDRVGGHACIAETSITLAIHPDLVNLDKAESGYSGDIFKPGAYEKVLNEGLHEKASNGVIGDPTGSNTELGELCINAYTKELFKYFRTRISR